MKIQLPKNRSTALRHRCHLGLYLGWLCLVLGARGVLALSVDDLSFYAPFDNRPEAVIAAGDAAPDSGGPAFAFEQGVRGAALVAGDPKVTLAFSVKDNLDDRQGSLSLWLKPLNWHSGDAQQHVYIDIPGRLLFYHYHNGGTSCFYWMNGSRVLWGTGGNYLALPTGQWQHLAVTWSKAGATMYFNGRRSKTAIDMPPDLPAWGDGKFRVAPSISSKNENSLTAVDELMIFKRPLDDAEVKSLYRHGLAQLAGPTVRIGEVDSAPTVAGPWAPEVWEASSTLVDFVDWPFGNLPAQNVKAHLAYDAQNLYLAFQPGNAFTGKDADGNLEVWLRPENGDGPCRFGIDANGNRASFSGQKVLAADLWKGSVVADDGPSESGKCFRLAIPWTLLNVTPTTGTILNGNIVWKETDRPPRIVAWADLVSAASYDQADSYGRIVLGGQEPVLATRKLGNLSYAQLDFDARVLNPSGRKQSLACEIRLQPTDLQEIEDPNTFIRTFSGTVLRYDQPVALAGREGTVAAAGSFSDTDINGFRLKLADEEGKIIYQAERPFAARPPVISTIHLYPAEDRVEVHADVSRCNAAPLAELSATVTLSDDKGNTLDQAVVKTFSKTTEIIPFPLKPLPLGAITVKTALASGKRQISEYMTSFRKIELGPWYRNQLGKEDIVLPPFTPVVVDGQDVSTWGRTYRWKDSLFPVQVNSAGADLLAGPIELVAASTATGNATPAKVMVTEHADTYAVVEARGEIAGVPVTAVHRIEYDGMCLTRLKFSPTAATELPALTLCIPYRSTQATLYHYFANAGAVNETVKEFRGPPMNGKADLPFRNTLWLGNEDRGMTWFAEDAAGWRLKGNPKPISISSAGDHTDFAIHFAIKPFKMEGELNLTFGVIATPVKPLPENWRFLRVSREWTYDWFREFTRSNNDIVNVLPTWKAVHAGVLAGEGTVIRAPKGRKIPFCLPYQRPDWINDAQPERDYFIDEWESIPSYTSGTDRAGMSITHHSVCLGSEWQDFMVYYAVKAYNENNMTGYYFDGGLPQPCRNRNHGHGWIDDEGNPRTTYPILAYREFYRRLALEFYRQKRPYLIWIHASNCLEMPTASFASMTWDGEQFSTQADATGDYTKLMTLDYFRGEFLGQQFGIPVQWLGEFHDKPEKKIGKKELDTMLVLALVHGIGDHTLASALGNADSYVYVGSVLDKQDAFGIREKDGIFLPYWNNQDKVRLQPADRNLVCSMWKREGKLLLVLGNCTGQDASVEVTLETAPLGLQGPLQATDAVSGESVPVTGNNLKVPVGASNWRLVQVSGVPAASADQDR